MLRSCSAEWFRERGYVTAGIGKIYHEGVAGDPTDDTQDGGFRFWEDVLKQVNQDDIQSLAVDILQEIGKMLRDLGKMLPPPVNTAFHKALEMARYASILPMMAKMKDTDLRGALSHAMSMPVLRLLAENNEEITRKILEKLLLNKSVRSHLDELKQKPANQELL